ncbi:Hypothetical protein UVM_LOCUS183 [uncultured virus]|nr:Hypothetical protein UVM_LOCUS183 [uncultured virus]
MGGAFSTTVQTVINESVASAMLSTTVDCGQRFVQEQGIYLKDPVDMDISGITFEQLVTFDARCIQNSVTDSELQNKVLNDLKAKVEAINSGA